MKREQILTLTIVTMLLALVCIMSMSCSAPKTCAGLYAKKSVSHAVTFNSKEFSKRHYR